MDHSKYIALAYSLALLFVFGWYVIALIRRRKHRALLGALKEDGRGSS